MPANTTAALGHVAHNLLLKGTREAIRDWAFWMVCSVGMRGEIICTLRFKMIRRTVTLCEPCTELFATPLKAIAIAYRKGKTKKNAKQYSFVLVQHVDPLIDPVAALGAQLISLRHFWDAIDPALVLDGDSAYADKCVFPSPTDQTGCTPIDDNRFTEKAGALRRAMAEAGIADAPVMKFGSYHAERVMQQHAVKESSQLISQHRLMDLRDEYTRGMFPADAAITRTGRPLGHQFFIPRSHIPVPASVKEAAYPGLDSRLEKHRAELRDPNLADTRRQQVARYLEILEACDWAVTAAIQAAPLIMQLIGPSPKGIYTLSAFSSHEFRQFGAEVLRRESQWKAKVEADLHKKRIAALPAEFIELVHPELTTGMPTPVLSPAVPVPVPFSVPRPATTVPSRAPSLILRPPLLPAAPVPLYMSGGGAARPLQPRGPLPWQPESRPTKPGIPDGWQDYKLSPIST